MGTQVNLQYPVPVFVRVLGGRLAQDGAGVIDHDIDNGVFRSFPATRIAIESFRVILSQPQPVIAGIISRYVQKLVAGQIKVLFASG